jgi:hypothetical protein
MPPFAVTSSVSTVVERPLSLWQAVVRHGGARMSACRPEQRRDQPHRPLVLA